MDLTVQARYRLHRLIRFGLFVLTALFFGWVVAGFFLGRG